MIFHAFIVVLTALPPLAHGWGSTRQQVQRTKRELQSLTRNKDYGASPYHPTQIVERIHSLESEAAWAELCQELARLPDDALELFEDEIRKPQHARHMACSADLVERITTYWNVAAKAMIDAHPRSASVVVPKAAPLQVIIQSVGGAGQAKVITGSDWPEGQIALTFDDGPHPTRTKRVLDILAAAGVKATFFQIGRNATKYPEITKQVLAAGHGLGSHTWSHPDLPKLPEGHAETEIESGEASVGLALGIPPNRLMLFRFPYGARTATEQAFVDKRGNVTFSWNMDSQDWRIRNPHKLFLNVLAELDRARRGVILFHDIHEQTVIVLPHLLDELRARNFNVVAFMASPNAETRE